MRYRITAVVEATTREDAYFKAAKAGALMGAAGLLLRDGATPEKVTDEDAPGCYASIEEIVE